MNFSRSSVRYIHEPPRSYPMLTEETLEASFRRMSDLAPVMIWITGRDEELLFLNSAWLDYTGRHREEPPESSWYGSMHPEDVQHWVRAYGPAFLQKKSFTVEFRLQRWDGEYRWMSCQGKPRPDAPGYMGTCVDVHDQHLNEEVLERRVSDRTLALQQANAALQQRNDELEQFAYVTSHDLQEPLRKIRVFVDMLQRDGRRPEDDYQESLARIRSSADRMAQLIKDLLTYSRLGLEGNPFVPTDLNTVVLAALRDFDLRIEETGARVHVMPLPIIEAIPLQMSQLFYNLVGNALKFQRPGIPPALRISAHPIGPEEITQYPSLDRDQAYSRIVVKDNGIGFNQKFVDKIFVIFQRLHPKDRFPGTGIGLAICRKIVQHHRGEIFAYGNENEGAEFHLILPRNHPTGTAWP